MKRLPRPYRWVLEAYAVVGAVLWPIPLLNILHAESAAVVAFASFFIAGLSSLHFFGRGVPVRRVLLAEEGALVVPWAMLTLSLLWAPNCGYLLGLLLYGLFPVITVIFAVGLAYALSGMRLRRKRLALVLIGLLIAVLGPMYDLGLHPQFYTYNHVFGGILGPIYDQELALRQGLFVFRGLTLLWGALFFLAGQWVRLGGRGKEEWGRRKEGERERGSEGERGKERKAPVLVAVTALSIGVVYFLSSPLGINTPGWFIQRSLGAVYRTEHFDIYYDPEAVTRHEIAYVALDHEYQYGRLARILDEEVLGRIRSYIYPDPETKARLTGARLTNVAPVWLPDPQVHVLLPVYEYVFPHELAHVFSREFGLPILNATLAVGLLEGLAVALEPPDGLPTPHEQVIVAALGRAGPLEGSDLAERLASTLSPFGFWTGRGAVSYTTMGSFVGYLLDAYGAEPLKEVYAFGNFEGVYGKPVEILAKEWEVHLQRLPLITSITGPLVERRFAVPSLFEVECPHYVPGYVEEYRAGMDALEAGDTLRALSSFDEALEEEPEFPAGLAAWAQVKLALGAPTEVVERLSESSGTDSLWVAAVALGDAYAVLGQAAAARVRYDAAARLLPAGSRDWQGLLWLRKLVAERPEATRMLTSGGPPQERAGRLEALSSADPAVSMLRALLLAEAEAFQQASELLEATPALDDPALPLAVRLALDRQRLEWLARFSYHAGMLEQAAAYAERAAEAWSAVGGMNEAAAMHQLVEQYRWVNGQDLLTFEDGDGTYRPM